MVDPNETVSAPCLYYPGSQPLGESEIRVIDCGTDMLAARRGQGAACFVVELGKGNKFVFDMGSGWMRNVLALNIPADFLDKVFLRHLHTDHLGDLDCMRAGGRANSSVSLTRFALYSNSRITPVPAAFASYRLSAPATQGTTGSRVRRGGRILDEST